MLVELILQLNPKNIASAYDLLAASGVYSLHKARENNSFECDEGIIKLINNLRKNSTGKITANGLSEALKQYLQTVADCNNIKLEKLNSNIKYYPGAAYLLKELLAPYKLHFNELQKDEFKQLKANLKTNFKIKLTGFDAYELIHKLAGNFRAARNKYNIIFLDPPYENAEEEELIINSIKLLMGQPGCIVMLWMPIKELRKFIDFTRVLRGQLNHEIIFTRLAKPSSATESLADNAIMLIGDMDPAIKAKLTESFNSLGNFLNQNILGALGLHETKILQLL
jgi:23S rRNA A2030 N6-methylase RlmJ